MYHNTIIFYHHGTTMEWRESFPSLLFSQHKVSWSSISFFIWKISPHTRWHCRVYYILRFEMCQHHSLCQGGLWRWSKTASWQMVQLFGGNFKTWHDGLVAARSGLLQINCKICFELGFLFCKKKDSAKNLQCHRWCICFPALAVHFRPHSRLIVSFLFRHLVRCLWQFKWPE